MADKIKIKASFHSGKGYARHNNHYPVKRDKGNIDYEQTANNRVWTRIKDVTDVVAAKKMVYDEFFTKELEMQNNGITILKDYVLTSRKTRNELYNSNFALE